MKIGRFKCFISIVLIVALSVLCLPSCASAGFSFSYEIRDMKQTYRPGEEFSIISTVKNKGLPVIATGSSSSLFRTYVKIYCGDYTIEVEPFVDTTDVVTKKLRKGESESSTYTVKIPDDAVLGSYNITVGYSTHSQTFENVFTIVD